jgi:hypothetical protein
MFTQSSISLSVAEYLRFRKSGGDTTTSCAGVRECPPRRFYDLRMGTVDFLVGKSVTEIRYFGQTDIRIVFDPGEKSEPALYADMSTPVLGTRDGATYAVSPKDPASVGPPVLAIVGQEVEGAVIEDGALTLGLSDGKRFAVSPTTGMRLGRSLAEPLNIS